MTDAPRENLVSGLVFPSVAGRLVIVLHVALNAIAIRRERRPTYRMARPAGHVGGLGHAMVCFLIVKRLKRLRKNLGMARIAFAAHPFVMLPVVERYIAVLGFKYDLLRRSSGRQILRLNFCRYGLRSGSFGCFFRSLRARADEKTHRQSGKQNEAHFCILSLPLQSANPAVG